MIDLKKIIAGIAAVALLGGGIFRVSSFQKNASKTSAAEIVKEETVERGNVTAGVTESAVVSVESLEQTYDLTLTSTSVSATVESSSGASGGMGGGMGSTSVSTSSESGSVALVVDEVCITEGQSIKAGDVLMTITQESIEDSRTLLTAKYEYDTRIAEGKNATAGDIIKCSVTTDQDGQEIVTAIWIMEE